MLIDKGFLKDLSVLAKSNPRLRQSYDLRNTPDDHSQRVINALEPGTVMPIHRHEDTSATVIVLNGSLRYNFYDNTGKLTESVMMKSGGTCQAVQVEKGRWHNLECLEPNTVIFETKDGDWKPYEVF